MKDRRRRMQEGGRLKNRNGGKQGTGGKKEQGLGWNAKVNKVHVRRCTCG